MYLIKRIAYKPNVLKEGFEDLADVLSEYSEYTIIDEIGELITEYFDKHDFITDYFVEGDVKGNEDKKDPSKMETALLDWIKKVFNEKNLSKKFYKKCMINDEINCNPQEKIFNQAIDKFGKVFIQEVDLVDMILETLEYPKLQEKYFTEPKPKLQKKKEQPKELSEETLKVLKQVEKDLTVNFELLSKADEPIGTEVITRSIDYGRRDYPFVVLDKDIVIKGTSKDTHTTALNKFMKKHMKENSRYQDVKNELDEVKAEEGKLWYREDGIDALKNANFTTLAFGHVRNNMAFIDTTMGCSVQEVSGVVKSELDVKKVYESEHNGLEFINTRVARLLPRYNVELHNMAIEEMKKYKK